MHLADYLAAERLDAVYTSPLRRAVETGAPVAARHGLDVVVVDDVAEWDRVSQRVRPGRGAEGGRRPALAGAPRGRVDERRDPGSVPRPRRSPRSNSSSIRIAGGRIAVVCHGGVINTYLAAVLGLDPARHRLLLPQLHVDPPRHGGAHRPALDRHDQRDVAPPRHRAAHRSAPDWLTMPGPHSLADLVDYLDASPSPFHAVESTRQRLDAAGFDAVAEADAVGRRSAARLSRHATAP